MKSSAVFLLLILSTIVASNVLQTSPIQEAATQIYTGPYNSYSSYQVTITISGLPSQYSANIKIDGNGQGSIQGGSSGVFQVNNTQSHVFQVDDYVSGPAGTRYACANSSWTLQQSQSSYNPYGYSYPGGGYGGYNPYPNYPYTNYPYNYSNYPPYHRRTTSATTTSYTTQITTITTSNEIITSTTTPASTITETTTITPSSESTTTTASTTSPTTTITTSSESTTTATGTTTPTETIASNVLTTTSEASSESITTTAASSIQASTTQASTTQPSTTQAPTTQAYGQEDRGIVYPEDTSEDLSPANYQQLYVNPVHQSPYGYLENYSYYYPNYPYNPNYPYYYPGYTGAPQAASHTFSYVPEYNLTVENPAGASIDKAGWQQQNTVLTLTTPQTINTSNQEKDIFKGWDVDGSQVTSSTVTLTMNMPHTANATYQVQYYVDVQSGIGQPQGSGWYDQGSTATISVDPAVPMSGFWGALGGSYVFDGWSGTTGSDLPNPTSTVTVDSPMTITAAWQPDYSTPGVILVIAIAAIAVVIILSFMLSRRGLKFRRESAKTGLDSLDLRYSRGEITRKEYLQKKKDIEGS